jgi:uncharacterized protein (DUF2336 family)
MDALLLEDEATRVRQGANPATAPDRLRALANDASVKVRATLAMNPAAPPDANRLLADDPDERVRVLLAKKLGGLTHGLPDAAQSRMREQALETLTRLVADEAVRVRRAIADALKDLPDAPKALILALARDTAVMVAEPVILFSPLLTSEDLMALVAAAPSSGTAIAVARRPAIDERVSDAVAASSNAAAIHALLGNPSAHIREAALDALVAGSAEHPDWQEPLVHRPVLPARAARALSEIVASHLLETLAARTDLDSALAQRLAERLALKPPSVRQDVTSEMALVEARRLARSGLLTEQALLAAVRRGEAQMVSALLAVAADVPREVVDRASSLRSAKGLVSLVWQAGFTMRAGGAVQGILGLLPPGEALSSGPGGGFPLSVDEMRWQMASLAREGQR